MVTQNDWAWRPSTGPGARSPAEREAFWQARAAEGAAFMRAHGVRPRRRRGDPPARTAFSLPPRRRDEGELRDLVRQALASCDSLEADEPTMPAPAGGLPVQTVPESPGGAPYGDDSKARIAWRRERQSAVSVIFAALRRVTALPADHAKLNRALAGISAGFDWDAAFPGRLRLTAEELRRECHRRIADALGTFTDSDQARRPVGPRSDDDLAMAAAFPCHRPVRQDDCWWAHPRRAPPPEPGGDDVRLPPPERRFPTLRADGLYDMHCVSCRSHDRDATGAYRTPRAHWQCYIHQLIFNLCDVHFPIVPHLAPSSPIIVEQIIERDPVIARKLEELIEADIDAGSLVPAYPGEVSIVVPMAAAVSRSLSMPPEARDVAGDHLRSVDPRAVAVVASRMAERIVVAQLEATVGLDRHQARGALRRTLQSFSDDPKVRCISCHDNGLNNICEDTSVSFGSVEELAGKWRPGHVYVVNDNERGFKSVRVAADHQRYLGLFHPTRPGVILKARTLDFGQKNAPFVFSAFTAVLNRHVRFFLGEDGWSIFYIDDNGVVCDASRVPGLIEELDSWAPRVGFRYALAKRQAAAAAKILGRKLDGESREISILPSKLYRTLVYLYLIAGLVDHVEAHPQSVADLVDGDILDSLAGTVQWLAECTYSGRLHTGPFWFAAREATRLGPIRLSKCGGLRSACAWWLDLVESGRLRGHRLIPLADVPSLRLALDPSYALPLATASVNLTDAHNAAVIVEARNASERLVLCSQGDASDDAWCIFVGGRAWFGLWAPHQRTWSSEARELYPILQLYARAPELLRGAFIVHALDSACAALSIDHGHVGSGVERQLLSAVYACADDLCADFVAWWTSRRLNRGPDDLSKCLSAATARSWAILHGVEITIVDPGDIITDYAPGTFRH